MLSCQFLLFHSYIFLFNDIYLSPVLDCKVLTKEGENTFMQSNKETDFNKNNIFVKQNFKQNNIFYTNYFVSYLHKFCFHEVNRD